MIDTGHVLVTTTETCVCNRAITTEPYWAIEYPGEPIRYFGHWACLDEWGWLPDDGPLGITHDHQENP